MSNRDYSAIGGERIHGEEIRTQNGVSFLFISLASINVVLSLPNSCFAVMAAMSIANIVKTSLGPVGLDKMMVDDVGVCHCIIAVLAI